MKSLQHLKKYLFKYRWRFILGILFIAISRLFSIIPAQIIRSTTDFINSHLNTEVLLKNDILSVVVSTFNTSTSKTLLLMAGLIIISALINGLFLFFTRQTIIVMSRLIEYDLKNEVYAHYQKLSASFYKLNSTGDLMNRISEDVSRVRMYLGPAIMYSINVLILFVFVIIAMLSVNVKLTLYVLIPLPVLSLIIYFVSDVINRKSEKVQRQLSMLSTFAQETFSGIRVLKTYLRENDMKQLYRKECERYKEKNLGLARVQALFQPMMILLIGISTVLTVYVGGLLVMRGEVTTGNIAEFVIYVNMLTWPVAAIGWITSLVQRAAASQKRINEFLDVKPEIINNTNVKIKKCSEIAFRQVEFVYPDTGIKVLNGISFKVRKGESLGIIGKTGSGKSTIANLICRIYDVTKGEILINNKEISNINLDDLRFSIGYVPQDGFLFSDTISNNIAFGKRVDSSDINNIREAAKIAAVDDEIMSFPEDYHTLIGERGITLSGGQKQRVAIARAVIKEPSILILDDCLSSLDTKTEEEVIHNLRPLMKKSVSIVCSHRVSSLKFCDKIMVLDGGNIIEFGKHKDLIDKKGIYFDLFQAQLVIKLK